MKQKQNAIDAKKAAAILQKFVGDDKTLRGSLRNVHHDKEAGVAVATDGRALIATKHGYDPNAEVNPDYPNWRRVIPSDKSLDASATVDPAALAKICATALRLARAVKCDTPLVEIAFGEERAIFDPRNLKRVAEAMAANGISEMKTNGNLVGHSPAVAKNADTTIVIMPMRTNTDGTRREGRKHDYPVVLDGQTGRVVAAPERDGLHTSEYLAASRKAYEGMVRDGGYDKRTVEKEAKRLAELEKRVAAEDEIDALMGASAPEAVKAETPAPAVKAAPAKKNAAPAPAPAPAPVQTVKAADSLAAWKPEEWKRLTQKSFHNEARVGIVAWAAASATTERAELAMMAADYDFICNEGRAAMSQELTDFRSELDVELEKRVVRVYGIDKWKEVVACL